jgi:hypothetical protein
MRSNGILECKLQPKTSTAHVAMAGTSDTVCKDDVALTIVIN